jgi:hypothetical protein
VEVGVGWRLVRRASQSHGSWHRTSDWLAGTEKYALPLGCLEEFAETEQSARGNCSFSVEFDASKVDSFMFATGDCAKWITVPAYSVIEAARPAAEIPAQSVRALFADNESVHWDSAARMADGRAGAGEWTESFVRSDAIGPNTNLSVSAAASSTFYVVTHERRPHDHKHARLLACLRAHTAALARTAMRAETAVLYVKPYSDRLRQ